MKIIVRNKFWDNSPKRLVAVESINGVLGIRCEKHWFNWSYFFEVNVIA